MVRDFLIWSDGYEWEIREVGCEDYSIYDDTKEYYGFYFSKVNDKGQLVFINADCFNDDMFENLDELFEEECNFTLNDKEFMKNIAQSDKDSFKGTFIEALKIAKERYENILEGLKSE